MSSEAAFNWQETTIGAVIDWFSSGDPFLKMEYSGSGVPVLSKGDVKPFGRLEHGETRFISHELARTKGYRTTRDGDYLLTTRDLTQAANFLGLLARVPSDRSYLINQGANVVRFKPTVSGRFMVYWCNGPIYRAYIKGHCVGSTQIHIRKGDFLAAPLWLPSIEEQERIVGVLGALDDRIDLLRETNATLEAIAQALFKSWFVDFDPVRAKMEGRTPEGMDEATAALFPDGFETSELGEVPRGWRMQSLDSIANYLNGLALQKFPPTGIDDLPVIKIAQLRKGDTAGADLASRTIKPEYIVQNGDVLFSWSGSLEVEIWCGGEGALNQHLFKVTSTEYPKWFYYLWTRNHLDRFRQIAASKATTMGHIQRSHLSAAQVVVASEAVIEAADSVFYPLIERVVANALQAQTLSTVRDTLLPRLISGQLRLPEAQAAVEGTL